MSYESHINNTFQISQLILSGNIYSKTGLDSPPLFKKIKIKKYVSIHHLNLKVMVKDVTIISYIFLLI